MKEQAKSLTKRILHDMDLCASKAAIKGAKVANRLAIFEFYQTIPELNIEAGPEYKRVSLIKWQAVMNSISSDDSCFSVLDIGCNTGLYSINMARLGHMVTAIDGLWYYKEFCHHACKVLGLENIAVGQMKVTPENVNILPQYDCIFFLNIFHHLCTEYGKENALIMLDKIYRKANKVLFFETEQSDSISDEYREVLPDMGESPREWMKELFMRKGAILVEDISYNNGRYLMAIFKE